MTTIHMVLSHVIRWVCFFHDSCWLFEANCSDVLPSCYTCHSWHRQGPAHAGLRGIIKLKISMIYRTKRILKMKNKRGQNTESPEQSISQLLGIKAGNMWTSSEKYFVPHNPFLILHSCSSRQKVYVVNKFTDDASTDWQQKPVNINRMGLCELANKRQEIRNVNKDV